MMAWYERAFGEFYLQLYAHRDTDEARRVLRLLFPGPELEGRLVLDLACGAGRYLPEIEARGGCAVGMDLSMPLLREAASQLDRPAIARADMRTLPLREASVDWVLSLFTSFGYFEDLPAHRRLVQEWARVAREGIVVDIPNPSTLERELVPESERELGGYRILESRRIESTPRRVVKDVRVHGDDGDVVLEYAEKVMLFRPEELEELFTEAGMHGVVAYGDYDGAAFDLDSSPRQLRMYRRQGDSR